MSRLLVQTLMAILLLLAVWFPTGPAASQARTLNATAPSAPVRLVFIHHSVGQYLLEDGLFAQLNANNYYVTDTNYGWGPADGSETIGDHTDIGQWYNWFLGPSSSTFLTALYDNTSITESLENSMSQPAGPNTVVLFKSCFPNSGNISGNSYDPPRISSPDDPNPIYGANSGDTDVTTVSNIKGLYRDLLAYFASRQDKLFIFLTPPPADAEAVPGSYALARAINNWLVKHWLDNYHYNNVAVFDYFNVLTSNGGDSDHNDLGWPGGNHHRLASGQVLHLVQLSSNFSAYVGWRDPPHPSEAGNLKAMGEFVPLLNVAYHAWQGDGGRPWFMGRSPALSSGAGLLLD